MKPQVLVAAIAMALVSLVGRQAWAQVSAGHNTGLSGVGGKATAQAGGGDFGPEPTGQSRENVEDLLMVELGNQPFLKLVDRQALQAVMKEHAIALSKVGDTKNAIALGKFAAADYLLYVLVAKDKALVQLVEVATGQVKLEDEVKLSADLPLFCAAIREKVLAALLPESQSVNRLTVGIAAFTNRSGTDRSDKLGIELQMALRSRLKDEAWTVVLERQYPTALLEEVDLARTGLVRGKAVETLPPADLVISGTMQDAGNEYVAGKPWEVKLDLTVRVRDRRSQVSQTCRSDAVETAADDIVRKINEFRGQPISPIGIPEKELWRRQARYLMPSSGRPYVGRPYGRIDERAERDTVEMIRAWENVLLLDSDDAEAMTNLGLCLIALNQDSARDPVRATKAQRKAAMAQCLAGSLLVERALRIQAAPAQALAFCWCAESLDHRAPVREGNGSVHGRSSRFVQGHSKLPLGCHRHRTKLARIDNRR